MIIPFVVFSIWDIMLQVALLLYEGFWSKGLWTQWDAGHYLAIAESGYLHPFQAAFFPLYPLCIRLLTELGIESAVSALVITHTSSVVSCVIFYALAREILGKKAPLRALLLFLSFPTSFFLIAAYSESLFLLFVLSFFLCLRRKNLIWAAIFSVLATITRPIGIAILLTFWWHLWQRRREFSYSLPWRFFYSFISLFGIVGLSAFNFSRFGDPVGFLSAQRFWQRTFLPPWETFWVYWQNLINAQTFSYLDILALVEFSFVFVFGFLTLSVIRSRKLPSEMKIYSVVAFMVPILGGNFASIPRYMLVSIPLFFRLTELSKNIYLYLGILMIFLSFLFTFVRLFAEGIWIA